MPARPKGRTDAKEFVEFTVFIRRDIRDRIAFSLKKTLWDRHVFMDELIECWLEEWEKELLGSPETVAGRDDD